MGTQKLMLRFDHAEHLEMHDRARTSREIFAKATGVQKALSILGDHNGRHREEWRLEGRGQMFAPGDWRDAL